MSSWIPITCVLGCVTYFVHWSASIWRWRVPCRSLSYHDGSKCSALSSFCCLSPRPSSSCVHCLFPDGRPWSAVVLCVQLQVAEFGVEMETLVLVLSEDLSCLLRLSYYTTRISNNCTEFSGTALLWRYTFAAKFRVASSRFLRNLNLSQPTCPLYLRCPMVGWLPQSLLVAQFHSQYP